MIDKLAIRLTDFICTEDYNNTRDRAKIQYGLNVLISEGVKIIFLIALFHLIGYQNYFYLSLSVLMSIRIFSGGIHVRGTLNCLLLTTILFVFTSVIVTLLPKLNNICYFSVSISALIILEVRAPICSVARPIRNNKNKLQFKITAIFMTLIWSIILLSQDSSAYTNCGFVTIFIQNIQLLLVKKPQY